MTATLFDLTSPATAEPASEDTEQTPAPFKIRVAGRVFLVTVWESFTSCDDDWRPVDVRDIATGMESQAIIESGICQDQDALIAESQFRDCCRSVYGNATRAPGTIVNRERLPEDFQIMPLITGRGVLEVLGASATAGEVLTLPGQLDRELYEHVAKLIEAAGGKWNRSRKGHVFPGQDAGDVVDALIASGGKVTTRQDLGYFPTPAPVVTRLLELADLAPRMDVLEPSAGDGAIASAVHALGCHVTCIELAEDRARMLGDGCYRQVLCADFLEYGPRDNPAGAAYYDRVIMNPPFAKRADIAHVTHALGFLRPGGRLVSVMSLGVMFRQDKATAAFRERVTGSGGWFEELPADAFKVSGTGAGTVIAVIPG